MSVNATNPVQVFQSNVTNLEGIRSSAEGVRVSLQEQLRQDQEAMIATLTSVFQQTMQTALAESEARHQVAMDGLRAENTVLQRTVEILGTQLTELKTAFVNHNHHCDRKTTSGPGFHVVELRRFHITVVDKGMNLS